MYVCMYGFGQPYLVVMQAHGLTVKNIPQDHLFSTAGIVCVYVCVRVCVCVCVCGLRALKVLVHDLKTCKHTKLVTKSMRQWRSTEPKWFWTGDLLTTHIGSAITIYIYRIWPYIYTVYIDRIYIPYMTVYLVTSLPKLTYIHRVFRRSWPTLNTRVPTCNPSNWLSYSPVSSGMSRLSAPRKLNCEYACVGWGWWRNEGELDTRRCLPGWAGYQRHGSWTVGVRAWGEGSDETKVSLIQEGTFRDEQVISATEVELWVCVRGVRVVTKRRWAWFKKWSCDFNRVQEKGGRQHHRSRAVIN